MPQRTLLDMTQGILSAMESDEVNAISDTAESLQVANIIKNTYYDLISNKTIPEHQKLFELTGLGDTNYPTIMKLEDDAVSVEWVSYDKRSSATDTDVNFVQVPYCHPTVFLERTNKRNSDDDDVIVTTDTTYTNDVSLLIRTDENPQFFTTFDDQHLVFDSHDSTIDTTLTGTKTQCWGTIEPAFSLTDAFVPDIDSDFFPYLFNAAKAVCFAELKQQEHAIAIGLARSHKQKYQNNKHRIKRANDQHRPNYGRKSR